MEKILNFSEPLDVELLDRVVSCMASNNKQEINAAQKVLTQFQEHPDAWSRVSTILQQSKNQNTKFIGLNILSNAIKYRWNILPQTQRDGIKNFVVNTIITKSKDEQAMQLEKTLISKLNEVLIQIVKQEWPHNWRNFIPDIVASSKSSESLCENNMNIFRLLSEEVFDFSSGKMTQKKIKELKESFNNEFSLIYQLCEFVLERAKKPTLITATLKTLLRFLNWIPLSYIFETKLIEALVTKFLPVNVFRNEALRCLTEIANQEEAKYDTKFEQMFVFSVKVLSSFLPVNSDFPKVYKHGTDYDQNFVQILALYLTTFFKKHLKLVEKEATKEQLLLAHNYLVEISKVDDTEVFKTCLEYWDFLAQDLFFTERAKAAQMQQNFGGLMISQPSRKQNYAQILSKVRTVMVSKMSRPEEVIIVEDDNGDIIKEYMKDVDAIQLYKSMKETLIFLTHLDYEDTEQIMVKKLENQVNGTEWS